MLSELLAGAFFYAGLMINTMLALLALWGLIGFFPRKVVRKQNAASWLIVAIWLGFLGGAMHTVTNGLITPIVLEFEWVSLDDWHKFVRVPLEVALNIVVGCSIYLHFYARWKSIPHNDQPHWHPLLMGFYPDLNHWAVQAGKRMSALLRQGNKP